MPVFIIGAFGPKWAAYECMVKSIWGLDFWARVELIGGANQGLILRDARGKGHFPG